MKNYVAQIWVDRQVLMDLGERAGRKYEPFTDDEITEMRGIINTACTQLEKFGFVRMQDSNELGVSDD